MRMGYAVLFPGQGSQFVGMGAELFSIRSDLLGEAADKVLGWSLSDTCLNGPEDLLTRTDRAQPALFAIAYALWEEFISAAPEPPAAVAGHSLGEYTALAAAGAFDFEDGLSLVAARGRAMAEAAASGDAATMAAVVGSPDDVVEGVISQRRTEGGQIWAANFNAPGQVVVAGAAADIDWLAAEAKSLGLRRVIPLAVGGAFHSPFMAPAAESLAGALADVEFMEMAFPVYANASAAPAVDIGESLVAQLTSPVRFVETLEAMGANGIDTFVHIGPGDVTAGLARKTIKDATVAVLSEPGDTDEVIAKLFENGAGGWDVSEGGDDA